MTKVFLDTNIILDYLCDRGEGSLRADELFRAAAEGDIECWIAPHTLTNIFYILRKEWNVETRKFFLESICTICRLQAVDEQVIRRALDDDRFEDFEDALQIACAEVCNAEFFVSRDSEIGKIISKGV